MQKPMGLGEGAMGKDVVGFPKEMLGLQACRRTELFPQWVLFLPFALMDWRDHVSTARRRPSARQREVL